MSTYCEDIINAINYLREQVQRYEIERGWHFIEQHYPLPSDIEMKIYDLLEEYGNDNDLPECWWEEYCDLEDIFMEL